MRWVRPRGAAERCDDWGRGPPRTRACSWKTARRPPCRRTAIFGSSASASASVCRGPRRHRRPHHVRRRYRAAAAVAATAAAAGLMHVDAEDDEAFSTATAPTWVTGCGRSPVIEHMRLCGGNHRTHPVLGGVGGGRKERRRARHRRISVFVVVVVVVVVVVAAAAAAVARAGDEPKAPRSWRGPRKARTCREDSKTRRRRRGSAARAPQWRQRRGRARGRPALQRRAGGGRGSRAARGLPVKHLRRCRRCRRRRRRHCCHRGRGEKRLEASAQHARLEVRAEGVKQSKGPPRRPPPTARETRAHLPRVALNALIVARRHRRGSDRRRTQSQHQM